MRVACSDWIWVGLLLAIPGAGWAQTHQQSTAPLLPTTTAPAPPPSSQPARDPRLEITPTALAFGDIWQGTPCKREFAIKNVSTEPLKLKAESSCGCTVPTQPKSPLEPGESSTFTVTYDTKHAGAAHKKVMLNLEGTKQTLWEIPVDGNVKPIYVATPPDPILFDGLEKDSVATKTIKLENKYERPVPLKLAPSSRDSLFNIQLKEIQPGMEYELTATTTPPLNTGFNRALAELETGLPDLDKLQFHFSANIQPRIIVTPMQLLVPPDATTPTQQTVRVQYRADKPVKVLDVHTSAGPIEWELLPGAPLAPGARLRSHLVRVALPAAAQVPNSGLQLLLTTDDPSPEFHEMKIPIFRGTPPAGQPMPTALAPSPPPTTAPTPAPPRGAPSARP
jgi:hypothetical protein